MNKFHMWAFQNFPFMEETFKEIDNYHLMMDILHYLKEQLKDYRELVAEVEQLEQWFNNLDVQEEINNKLDEMVESGELQEIISAYLNSQAIFGYDNVSDMLSAENLVDGSYARTLGFYSIGDGGSASYKIRTITNEDVVDNMTILPMSSSENLIAELIIDDVLNIKQLGSPLNGTNDDSDYLTKAVSICNNIIYPKDSTSLLNEVEIPSFVTVDFNYSTIKTGSVAIKESSLDETSGYNYRKCITIKNMILDLSENQKGISLCNTIESTLENIITTKNTPANCYVIYVVNSFNITFKDIYISGANNTISNGSYGIYVLATNGGIAGTNNITNLKFTNCLIQRIENGITFDKSENGTFDSVLLENIGFSWCNKCFNATDNLSISNFKNIHIDTIRAELSNYGVYSNGYISLRNIHTYNCGYGIYNKGRMQVDGFVEVVGTVEHDAIYNSGYMDLTNTTCSLSSSYTYTLGSEILKSKSQNIISSNSTSLAFLNEHPEPVNYDCNFTGTQLFYSDLKVPANNTIINFVHSGDIKLYVASGVYYDIKSYDALTLLYKNNKWYITTSATLVDTN